MAAGDPADRGHSSARLREALLPHLDAHETASLDNMLRRMDTLCDAVLAKVQPLQFPFLVNPETGRSRGMAAE